MTQLTITLPDSVIHFIDQFPFIPSGYQQVYARPVQQDGQSYWLARFEPVPNTDMTLGGEHFSLVIDADQERLMGMTWMDKAYTLQTLPTPETAESIARNFTAQHASDIHDGLEVLWIKQHDEQITVDAKTITVSGMKVKMRHHNGRYAWVIVGHDHQIITFERNIIWNFDMSKRTTEKWLHDQWLRDHLNNQR